MIPATKSKHAFDRLKSTGCSHLNLTSERVVEGTLFRVGLQENQRENKAHFTRLELGPQQTKYLFCLVSGKQRDPKKRKKGEPILGKFRSSDVFGLVYHLLGRRGGKRHRHHLVIVNDLLARNVLVDHPRDLLGLCLPRCWMQLCPPKRRTFATFQPNQARQVQQQT